jgi:hypothetical protein
MPPQSEPPTPASDLQAKLAKDIERVGWVAIGVMPTEDDPIDPFTYTLNLWRKFDHPELIVTGMRQEVAHSMIAGFISRIEQGDRFDTSLDHPKALQGQGDKTYTAAIRPVTPTQRDEHLRFADWWNGGEDFPAMQIVWPDPAGLFPWEDGYDRRYLQPLLTDDG